MLGPEMWLVTAVTLRNAYGLDILDKNNVAVFSCFMNYEMLYYEIWAGFSESEPTN